MKVSPHTIPGILHSQNQTAFDWGWQGLIAYGCHSTVVVVDPHTIQPLQTLSQHKTNVIKVRWSRECYHHMLASPYTLRLASVDVNSHCVIWDVAQASVNCEFSLGNKPLVDIQWLTTNDSCRDLLAVMISPSSMTIWNADTGTKISRFTFTETIVSFAFNPFQPENLVLQSPDCFIFVSDFNPSRVPTGGGKKFYMTSTGGGSFPFPGRGKSPNHGPRQLLSGDDMKGEESVPLADCLQIAFSRSYRHHLFIVYPREIVIMDIEIKQAVGSIHLERNNSAFHHVMPCSQRDVLYCLHENGCVSVRVQQSVQLPHKVPTSPLESQVKGIQYDLHCHSEPLRISKTCQVYAGGFCPLTEKRVAVLTSEGRILFWDVEVEQVGIYGQEVTEEELTLLTACPVTSGNLVDVQEADEGYGGGLSEDNRLTLAESIAPHWFLPPEGSTATYGLLNLKLILGCFWSSISGLPTAVRMCPPLTTKNWSYYNPLLAVGTSTGFIFIFNLSTRAIVKEYAIHTCTIQGIEWLSQTSFVTYAHTHPHHNGAVRNEIVTIDIQTGRITHLKRPDVTGENNHQTRLETIKISAHKNYMVVKYKDRPLEFWDVKTLTFNREVVSNPPSFSCVEWFPTHSKTKPQKTDPGSMGAVDFDVAMGTTDSKIQSPERELLTVMDDSGAMWQLSIEGSKVRVVNSAPTQTWLSNPTGVAWKGDLMAAGDQEGVIVFYDSRNPQMRTLETPRGGIKKLRFAPGKGNTKLFVLYNNRIDIRDAVGDGLLGHLKWGGAKDVNSHFSVEDADWATSDKLVLVTSDGCVRVYDTKLQNCQSVVNILEFGEPVFCPRATFPQSTLRLKSMLQHQPWNVEYGLDADELDDVGTIEKGVKQQLQVLPEEFRYSLLDSTLGTPQRALTTATLFGDENEVAFWNTALYYLLREKNRMQDPRYPLYKVAVPRNPSSDIIRPDSSASIRIIPSLSKNMDDFLGPLNNTGVDSEPASPTQGPLLSDTPPSIDLSGKDIAAMLLEAQLKTIVTIPHLDLGWDLLCDSETYQRMQLERVLLHDSKRQTYDHTRKCAETLLLLGQTDRAVQLLLETDSSSSNYYTDALKACLAATIRSSGASQSAIKLVATNLIANSRLMEGSQLLCLIDKGLDACRYLQTYGEWYHSVWLAKSTLSERDCNEVFLRWVDYLVAIDQKNKALLVLLSLGQFQKALEMLYNMRYFDRAAVFAEACLEYGVIKHNKETTSLVEAVFLEYARYLQSLGFTRGMRHYCGKAGEKGSQLLDQYITSGLKKSPLPFDLGEVTT